jgi:hypothetical protein
MNDKLYIFDPPSGVNNFHDILAVLVAVYPPLYSLDIIPERVRYLFRECPATATQPAPVQLAIQDDEATIDDLVRAMMTTPGTMRGFAIAILQHVRAGKVRGLTTTVEAQDALTTEFHAHQAEVQRLRDLLREALPHVERSAFSFRATEGLAERIAAECGKEK